MRWMGVRSLASTAPMLSSGSPRTLNRRPRVAWPTGTVMGCPGVDRFGAAAQAVGGAHSQAAHPVVAQVLLDLGHDLAVAHLDLDGIVDRREARPAGTPRRPPCRLSAQLSPWPCATSVLFGRSESLGAADDIQQLLGNRLLAYLVVSQSQVLDHIIGGLSRAAHGDHPR